MKFRIVSDSCAATVQDGLLVTEAAEEMRKLGFTGDPKAYQIGCTIGVHTGPAPIGIAVIKKYDVSYKDSERVSTKSTPSF